MISMKVFRLGVMNRMDEQMLAAWMYDKHQETLYEGKGCSAILDIPERNIFLIQNFLAIVATSGVWDWVGNLPKPEIVPDILEHTHLAFKEIGLVEHADAVKQMIDYLKEGVDIPSIEEAPKCYPLIFAVEDKRVVDLDFYIKFNSVFHIYIASHEFDICERYGVYD